MASAEAAPSERPYTVDAGDSLWAIGEEVSGSGNEGSRIFEAGRDHLDLDNADMIQPVRRSGFPDGMLSAR